MNENETRKNLIDEQLNLAGWKADTQNLNYKLGTRPTLGENIAIAEYPTSSGPADYILFCGLDAIATVEAKKDSKDVPGDLTQAKRYSKDFQALSNADLSNGIAYTLSGTSINVTNSLATFDFSEKYMINISFTL